MRIQFSLSCQKGVIIPINYQSEISNWIFSVLAKGGAEFSAWVQHRGYDLTSHSFKLFTFSPLAIYPYEMDQVKQEFKLLGNQVKLNISFYIDPVFEQQIITLFRQMPLQLGTFEGKPAQFEVKHWQILPRPNFKEIMQFKAVSPISISSVEDGKSMGTFPLPDNEAYDINLFHHVVRKYKAANQNKSLANLKLLDPAYAMHYRLMSPAKSRLIHLKPNMDGINQLRGFVYEFELTLPPWIMEFVYYSGLGEFGHLGFGYIDFK